MFVSVKRKKRKPQKDDYKMIDWRQDILDTKRGRKWVHLARPDLIKIVERYALIFELVEAYSDDNGKPKQRRKYLASIREEYADKTAQFPYSECSVFWKSVTKKFNLLGLTDDEISKLSTSVEAYVSIPTTGELDAEKKRWFKVYFGS